MAEGYEPNPNPSVTSDMNVEITNYGAQNQYTCPEDGYVFIYKLAPSTGMVEISILPNGYATKLIYGDANKAILDTFFVRRGTTVRVINNTSSASIYFRGIKNVY